MTRDEARHIVRQIRESAYTERQIADFVDCLSELGIIKFESESAKIEREVSDYLAHRVVGVYPAYPGGCAEPSRAMALDVQGGKELLRHLDQGGYKVVRK